MSECFCKDHHRNLARAEELLAAGVSPEHPLVGAAMRRAEWAKRRTPHLITLGGQCPDEEEA
jgi:hypothetical protein